MDDRAGTSTIGAVMAVAGCLLLLVLAARAVFGQTGVEAALVVAMVVLVAYAYEQLSGKRLPRPSLRPRPAVPAPAAPVVEDTWRSERWIAEAVERGVRALDEWRLEQSEA